MRLSLAEAIRYLGVSEGTARRWIRESGPLEPSAASGGDGSPGGGGTGDRR
jgi:predicted site-specific integrase-resolvase